MHATAEKCCKEFVNKYCLDDKTTNILTVIDIGSLDINGALRPLFQLPKYKYIGLDCQAGRNVDIILSEPYKYPISDNFADLTVSTSCFEHDELFWLSFNEMVRITKSGGLIYINAPHKFKIHRYPVDCWRFCPDGFAALSKWNTQAKLLESYIADDDGISGAPEACNDCVGIYRIIK